MTSRQLIVAYLAAAIFIMLVCGALFGCATGTAVKPLALPLPDGMRMVARGVAPAAPVVPSQTVTNRVRISWYQPGRAGGWVVEESTNLLSWFQVVRLTGGGSNVAVTNNFTTVNNPAFWRVGSFR